MKKKIKSFWHSLMVMLCFLSVVSSLLAGCQCHPSSYLFEPKIVYFPQEKLIQSWPECFSPLSPKEAQTDWGKELTIADSFAKELDLYRALTSYKRALILIPKEEGLRRQQVEFGILFAYYLGAKYHDTINTFETSDLASVQATFPAFRNMLIILYDSYQKIGELDKACAILKLMTQMDADLARDLELSTALSLGDRELTDSLLEQYPGRDEIQGDLLCYDLKAKSVKKAQMLNGVLPGAGYYYVGQTRSAVTSFLINAAFIAATYQFMDRGYPAAALITGSLELGWYLGGINGAGLAAKEYNEALYSQFGKNTMLQHRLFPVLMFQCAF